MYISIIFYTYLLVANYHDLGQVGWSSRYGWYFTFSWGQRSEGARQVAVGSPHWRMSAEMSSKEAWTMDQWVGLRFFKQETIVFLEELYGIIMVSYKINMSLPPIQRMEASCHFLVWTCAKNSAPKTSDGSSSFPYKSRNHCGVCPFLRYVDPFQAWLIHTDTHCPCDSSSHLRDNLKAAISPLCPSHQIVHWCHWSWHTTRVKNNPRSLHSINVSIWICILNIMMNTYIITYTHNIYIYTFSSPHFIDSWQQNKSLKPFCWVSTASETSGWSLAYNCHLGWINGGSPLSLVDLFHGKSQEKMDDWYDWLGYVGVDPWLGKPPAM